MYSRSDSPARWWMAAAPAVVLTAAAALPAAARPAPPAPLQGVVTQVIDGDTLRFNVSGQPSFEVRLAQIDAPEICQAWGAEAKRALSELALNAAVEAARAGEQGRGFAVVATEVRALAGRSAAAAKEIKSLIGASIEQVEQGNRIAADAGATIREIVSNADRINGLMTQISTATREQSAGVAQVGTAVQELDRSTQQNAALVEETSAASGTLSEQASQLAREVSFFKLK